MSRPSASPPQLLREVAPGPAEAGGDRFDFLAEVELDSDAPPVSVEVEPAELEPAEEESATPAVVTDAVRIYLRGIGRGRLLTAVGEVDLARQIEAGLFAADRLAAAGPAGGTLPEPVRRDLEAVVRAGELAKNRLVEAILRLVVSIAKRYVGRDCRCWT